ncbi:hypothetical protein DFA_09920 [Cavenderia fasciculata]|uniref:Pentacotripeptide-repeat region of PRORP domain-containing protein n=1 Tax=Cavenderia fasciculata TaxID=261658 RepID=F4Q8S7_CACFS|nr:uncharacterized protein DFA_09920 [Cavenderia fasciculata]EGG15096.1 hypothetical protein DFA_09920 [Cavenderia fasciculata]|eukprot:XP_004351816.1 hypothetical protein DFA_09920 [Cavenderia fasciculata]
MFRLLIKHTTNNVSLLKTQHLVTLATSRFTINRYSTTSSNQPEQEEEVEEDNGDWMNKITLEKKVSSVNDILNKNKTNIKQIQRETIVEHSTNESNQDEGLLQEIEKARVEIDNDVPIDRSNLTIATLVRVCGRLKNDRDIVNHLIRRLLQFKQTIQLDHFHQLMVEYTQKGSQELIIDNLYKMLNNRDIVEKINNKQHSHPQQQNTTIQPTVETFNLMLKCYASNGSIDRCISLIEKDMMKEKLVQPNQESYALVVQGLADANRPDQAYSFLLKYIASHQINGIDQMTDCFNSIIACHSRMGQSDKIETLVKAMKQNQCQLNCLTRQYQIESLLKQYNNKEAVDQALKIIKEMDADNTPTTTLTFYKMYESLARLSRSDELMQLFGMMTRNQKPIVESLPSIEDDFYNENVSLEASTSWKPNIHTFNSIIESLCRCGQLDQAFGILDQMTQHNVQPTGETFSSLEALSFKLNQMDKYNRYCNMEFHIIKKN